MAVNAGKATESQKNLVESFFKVISELETKALMHQMQKEAEDIEARRRAFEKKWRILEAGIKVEEINDKSVRIV